MNPDSPALGDLGELLAEVRRRFYPADDTGSKNFHRDRRMLIYALSWPATWLEPRALTCSAKRYRALVADRLDAIAAHGDPERYGAYFPSYLLKCLQDWFRHHGDELYDELKHIRNALDHVLASLSHAATVRADGEYLDALACAHRLIRSQRSKPKHSEPGQLSLF